MTTIVTIVAGDQITNSRADLNTNFANLNSDKIETSYLDTDTALTANSDTKIATQKAVKAYVDSGGNVNASETTKGIVEEANDAEITAGTATGGTGAKLFVTPAKLATRLSVPSAGTIGNSSYVAQNGGTTVTLSHTVATNDTLLVVFINNDQAISGITYGGVAMTAGDTTSTLNSMYYKINPTVGTANIVATIPSGGNTNMIGVSFASMTNLALDTIVYSTASSTTLTKSSTSIVPTFGVFGFFAAETSATAPYISNGQVRKIVVSGARNYNAIVGSFVYGTTVTATFASPVNIYGVLGSFTFT